MAVKIKYRIKFSAEALKEQDKTADDLTLNQVKEDAKSGISPLSASILRGWVESQGLISDDFVVAGDVEKKILKQMISSYASKTAKDIEKYAMALDLIDMIKHADNELVIEKEDMEAIVEGFRELAKNQGGRPHGWTDYPKLFRQLRNPETVEEE